jgi:hypothetical protein
MYNWRDNLLQAKENIETAITSIETTKTSTYIEYKESVNLDTILLNLQHAVSLIMRLLPRNGE